VTLTCAKNNRVLKRRRSTCVYTESRPGDGTRAGFSMWGALLLMPESGAGRHSDARRTSLTSFRKKKKLILLNKVVPSGYSGY